MKVMKKLVGIAFLSVGIAALAADIDGISVVNASGDVKVKGGDQGEFAVPQAGQVLEFNAKVETGKDSQMDFAFSDGNTGKVYPMTGVQFSRGLLRRKYIRAEMINGKVGVNLKQWPAGYRFTMRTPLGYCEAMGTEYTTAYQDLPNGGQQMICEVTEGVVNVDTDTVRTDVEAGNKLVVTVYDGYASTVVDLASGGAPLDITFMGKHQFTVQANSSIRLAVSKQRGVGNFIAFTVMDGQLTVGDATFSAGESGYISGDMALSYLDAPQFVEAAFQEATAGQQIKDGIDDPGIIQQQKDAAKQIAVLTPPPLRGNELPPQINLPAPLKDVPQSGGDEI